MAAGLAPQRRWRPSRKPSRTDSGWTAAAPCVFGRFKKGRGLFKIDAGRFIFGQRRFNMDPGRFKINPGLFIFARGRFKMDPGLFIFGCGLFKKKAVISPFLGGRFTFPTRSPRRRRCRIDNQGNATSIQIVTSAFRSAKVGCGRPAPRVWVAQYS